MLFLRAAAAAALLASASAAMATTVVVNFESAAVGLPAGMINGVVFTDFLVANAFGPTSPPNFIYNNGANPAFDYAPGFTSFRFTAGVFSDSIVSVYSGLGGTGTLLGSVTVTNPPASPNAFSPWTVSFTGIGQSVLVTASFGQFGMDDVTLGVAGSAVPEPAGWAMLIAGFGLAGAVARRRRAVAIA
ncbi:MAG: PEPxxWA-CTERM sorting domain-containing protein [Sphingomonadales bacterium]|jgi:hypothetical protein